MDELRQLSVRLGGPGVGPLWLAAQRAGLNVKRKDVVEFVRRKGEKQVFLAPQRAAGKTVTAGENATWMMDLIDMKSSPGVQDSVTYKMILVVVNVFDRFTWTRALKGKEPSEVKAALESILAASRPKVIASDKGREFGGPVEELLESKGIAHRVKAPGDLNSMGVVDRTIQTLKQKLREFNSKSRQTWPNLLERATQAVNKTPKPVLHGEAPETVQDSPEVRFLLQQDNARSLAHNKRLTERRQAQLEKDGAFRAPLPTRTGELKRPLATFGVAERVRSVEGGVVTATSGVRYPLKQVRAIPLDSTDVEPRFGADTAGPERKRQRGDPILEKLKEVLEAEQSSLSLTRASQLLREAFRAAGRDYGDALKVARAGRLIELVRLDARFRVVEKGGGFYVALK